MSWIIPSSANCPRGTRVPVTACPAPREGWQRSQQQRTVPAVQDSRAVWAEPANPALFLCQDLLAPCTALGKVFCAQRWHWKAGSSSGTALLLLGVYFLGCLLPALAVLECRDQSGCVSFPCVVWIKTPAESEDRNNCQRI